MVEDVTDGRLLRGARTRRVVLQAAVEAASGDGLEGLSFGRLADSTGLSKAGVQALFRTKQALQLATIEHAAELFRVEVVEPAASLKPGAARLRGLIERWIAYVEKPMFPGGCFWVATMAEQDSRPGPVRDALVKRRDEWVALLGRDLRKARPSRTRADAELAAFQLDAVLSASNSALLVGDTRATERIHATVDALVGRPRAAR